MKTHSENISQIYENMNFIQISGVPFKNSPLWEARLSVYNREEAKIPVGIRKHGNMLNFLKQQKKFFYFHFQLAIIYKDIFYKYNKLHRLLQGKYFLQFPANSLCSLDLPIFSYRD